jgi:hypothetical protein
MTYAAGLKAETIVWIANPFTDEHRAAVDWLNEITDDHLKFFGLEVEVWRIGDSAMAPKFNIVAKPNDWSKDVSGGKARVEVGDLTDTKQMQLEFWTAFRDFASNSKIIRPTKPRPQHWMNMSIGRSGFNLTAVASLWSAESESYDTNEIRAQVEIFAKSAKADFEALLLQQAEIEDEIGYPLIWMNDPKKVSCRITVLKAVDLKDLADWPHQCAWLTSRLEELHRVFSPRIKRLDAPFDS